MIIIIKYVKPALNRELTAHNCGSLQFVEAPGQVPILPSCNLVPRSALPPAFRSCIVTMLRLWRYNLPQLLSPRFGLQKNFQYRVAKVINVHMFSGIYKAVVGLFPHVFLPGVLL